MDAQSTFESRLRFPRSSQYHPDWINASVSGGANSLWLSERMELTARRTRQRSTLSATATGRQRIAASIPATSIFFICIIASNARLAVSPPAAIAPVRTIGVICQEIPHLSLHHPH